MDNKKYNTILIFSLVILAGILLIWGKTSPNTVNNSVKSAVNYTATDAAKNIPASTATNTAKDLAIKLEYAQGNYKPGDIIEVSLENIPTDKRCYLLLKKSSDTYPISRRCIWYKSSGSFKFLTPNQKASWHFELVDEASKSVLAKSNELIVTQEIHDNTIDDHLNVLDRAYLTPVGSFNLIRQGNNVKGLYEFNNGSFEGVIKYEDTYGYVINGKFIETIKTGTSISGEIEVRISSDSEECEMKWRRSDSKNWLSSKGPGSWCDLGDFANLSFTPKIDEIDNGNRISWNYIDSKDITGYNIYRKIIPGSSDFIKINEAPLNNNEYVDAGIPSLRAFSYIVKAVFADNHEETISQYDNFFPDGVALIEMKPSKLQLTRIRNKLGSWDFNIFEKKPDYDMTNEYSRILNGKLTVPLITSIGNAFGGEITLDANNKSALIKWNGKSCTLHNGSTDFTFDGKLYKFTNPPYMNGDTMNVEIDTLLKALGMKTEWVKEGKTLCVGYTP
ncbi:stalk domain-containing protein [Pseudobacteroides cellulosolvens]|uniref:Copper amine oxidase-like domain-containing protein n=1 Tax=Pseudobacteroides cellulosolvens ATCC 35603 = DSM 2933 TaxID=398512 RepID=A0A0L6JHN0_9FIRM|nr:stalk domain-containing protein [Pseudobacteroides cellulosolvens]KNY25200.1 copper amine oxidase-like domain-containing protein [Pseudobacteroides cellulosolvens ATCC 35603 = DSM 2933]